MTARYTDATRSTGRPRHGVVRHDLPMADEPVEAIRCGRCGGQTETGYLECGTQLRWLPLDADLDRARSCLPFTSVQPALVEARRCEACRLILIRY
jgi:hypothetical protein